MLEAFPLRLTVSSIAVRFHFPSVTFCSAATYLAPTTELERRIAEIWQDVLGVDPDRNTRQLFELGGNSLALVLMNVRLERNTSDGKFYYRTVQTSDNYLVGRAHWSRSAQKFRRYIEPSSRSGATRSIKGKDSAAVTLPATLIEEEHKETMRGRFLPSVHIALS